jgi:hypothetical protein
LPTLAQVLQNMSVAPRTVLRHTAPAGRPLGHGIVFALPRTDGAWTPRRLLFLLDGVYPDGPLPEVEAELRRRLNAIAQSLALPAAAAVADHPESADSVCQDLPSILAVLAKSSGSVYLRDKEPNLAAIRPERRVVVLVPPERKSG